MNRKLDGVWLFAYFQYISGDIAQFYRLGGMKMDQIVKERKWKKKKEKRKKAPQKMNVGFKNEKNDNPKKFIIFDKVEVFNTP